MFVFVLFLLLLLQFLVVIIIKQNVLFIDENMNAQIENDGNNKFWLYYSPNRNDRYRVGYPHENRFACLNTKFQKRKEKLWPLIYPNNCKAQLNYIIINKKWINSALNSFERVSSNHRIALAKIGLSLRRNR